MLTESVISGRNSIILLLSLKQSDGLPSYDRDRVDLAIADLVTVIIEHAQLMQEPVTKHLKRSIYIVAEILNRHVRMLATYHLARLRRVSREMVYSAAARNQDNLTESERDFAQKFTRLRQEYLLETRASFTQTMPGHSILVEVFCAADIGDVMLSDGRVVRLESGSLHTLPRADVDMYIHAGQLHLCAE